MTTATIEIKNVSNRCESIITQLPFFKVEKDRIVMKSWLQPTQPLNDHLVWLWGNLKLKRKFLKGLQDDGAKLICVCTCPKEEIELKPNGVEMLHLLGMNLKIKTI